MSGRSAHVRIKNTKVKDSLAQLNESGSQPSISSGKESAMHGFISSPFYQEIPPTGRKHNATSDRATIRSTSDKSEDGSNSAYARAKKVPTPVIEVSGIEKSSFRQLIDKKSDGFRKGVSKTFGGKKKRSGEDGVRPETAATMRPNTHELESDYAAAPAPSIPRTRSQQFREDRTTGQDQPRSTHQDHSRTTHGDHLRPAHSDYSRPPPQTKLPAIPEASGLKCWTGNGKPPQTWSASNLKHDMELWDPLGDTLIYLCNDGHRASRPEASFRVSSHVIEATESRYLIELLRHGAIEDDYSLGIPPSPLNSGPRNITRRPRMHPTPPTPDGSAGGWESEVMYEMYFPVTHGLTKSEALRHQVATRNVLALLYQVSLVGTSLYEALCDLTERLAVYIPQEDVDTANMVIEFVLEKGFDDVRENPSGAAALLAWSERADVRWDEGWREGFVHAAGMITRIEASPNYKDLSTLTRMLLDASSAGMGIRVKSAEKHLERFEPTDLWPTMSSQPPPAQAAFRRMVTFFLHHYQGIYQTWPPPAAAGGEQWLTRSLVKKLQTDFGALYDYLVNREVVWDGSQERNGRKWNMKSPGSSTFDPDTPDLPITDILVEFDNRHKFVHIPHPYPLVPDQASISSSESQESLSKSGKQSPRPVDRMAERKAALAYTESTNIYVLGTDFVNNTLVEAFSRFEKADSASGIDPFVARRGRWVLIYGVLQVLSSVSVDTPHLRCKSDISYHLSPSLRATPPWRPNSYEEASQTGSHCWTVRSKWNLEPSLPSRRGPPTSISRNNAPSISGYSESDAGSSYRSPVFTTASMSSRSNNTSHHSRREAPRTQRLYLNSDQGSSYERDRVHELPISDLRERSSRAELRSRSQAESAQRLDDGASQAGSVSTRYGNGSGRSRTNSAKGKTRVELPREFDIKDFDLGQFPFDDRSARDEWKI